MPLPPFDSDESGDASERSSCWFGDREIDFLQPAERQTVMEHATTLGDPGEVRKLLQRFPQMVGIEEFLGQVAGERGIADDLRGPLLEALCEQGVVMLYGNENLRVSSNYLKMCEQMGRL